jgi:hypothetical protein
LVRKRKISLISMSANACYYQHSRNGRLKVIVHSIITPRMTDFQSQYQNLSDGELLHLWRDRSQLLEEAQSALASEIRNRGLSSPPEKASRTEKKTDKPKALLSELAPLAIIPICALAAVIIFFVLPVQFRNKWGAVAYVLVTCFALILLIARPKGLFRMRKSALVDWFGLLGCASVASFVVKWSDAGGRTVLWRGTPLPAGLVYGMLGFVGTYLTLFFGFGMYRSASWPRSPSRGGRG